MLAKCKTDKNYIEVFDDLFKTKIKQYFNEQLQLLKEEGDPHEVEDRIFCFAEKRFNEIEKVVTREHEVMKGIT